MNAEEMGQKTDTTVDTAVAEVKETMTDMKKDMNAATTALAPKKGNMKWVAVAGAVVVVAVAGYFGWQRFGGVMGGTPTGEFVVGQNAMAALFGRSDAIKTSSSTTTIDFTVTPTAEMKADQMGAISATLVLTGSEDVTDPANAKMSGDMDVKLKMGTAGPMAMNMGVKLGAVVNGKDIYLKVAELSGLPMTIDALMNKWIHIDEKEMLEMAGTDEDAKKEAMAMNDPAKQKEMQEKLRAKLLTSDFLTVKSIGSEVVNGVNTERVEFDIDFVKLAAVLPSIVNEVLPVDEKSEQMSEKDLAELKSMLSQLQVESKSFVVWYGADKFPVQTAFSMVTKESAVTIEGETEVVPALSLTGKTMYTGVNKPVTIEVPKDSLTMKEVEKIMSESFGMGMGATPMDPSEGEMTDEQIKMLEQMDKESGSDY
jgi:hypothetical protein